MNALKTPLQHYLVCFIIILTCASISFAQIIFVPVPVSIRQVDPGRAGIQIEQVNFEFDAGLVPLSDWGQLKVKPHLWSAASGFETGYLNVFISEANSSAKQRQHWQIQNLRIPKILASPCDPVTDAGSDVVLTTYFDLRPETDRTGRVNALNLVVLTSAQPLPVIQDFLNYAQRYTPKQAKVISTTINAQGDLGEKGRIINNPNRDLDSVGPAPVIPTPLPEPPLDLQYPIEVFQTPAPNVECAWNQCVPMAHANVLGYLENRYNGGVLSWSLPHDQTLGLGRVGLSGDIVIWQPVPEDSLVANIDSRTRRNGTQNRLSGSGSDRCQNIEGIMTYLGIYGDHAQTEYLHQGGDQLYGEGGSCDNNTQPYNGRFSQRDGENPTWEWIFQKLQQGHGIAMSYGRYDPFGERTGGHMLRVWGAAQYNNRRYLFTLDDEFQNNDSSGLRVTQWEVADTGSPGNPGVPDGRLNLNGSSWEVEFAIAAEAKPTLNIP